jgi:hypothetical protein
VVVVACVTVGFFVMGFVGGGFFVVVVVVTFFVTAVGFFVVAGGFVAIGFFVVGLFDWFGLVVGLLLPACCGIFLFCSPSASEKLISNTKSYFQIVVLPSPTNSLPIWISKD